MQTVPSTFNQSARAGVRQPSWQLRISFDKQFDEDVTFFELDTSVLDGVDVLAPDDNNVVQEWDKYDYLDYTDRVMQLEWTREEDVPYSVNLAMADVLLNNYDSFFTRGSSSLDPNLLPRRPLRILSGFKDIVIPQFVGLTDSVPKVSKSARTASLHCVDFLSFLFNKPLDQTITLVDYRTDQILDYLFQLFGLTPSQYSLDEGFNTVRYAHWEKGKKLGDAIRELMQAELGSLYMDEVGIIRFRNRVKSSTSPVLTFDDSNIIDYELSEESQIINVVEIKSSVREVQPKEVVYTTNSAIELAQGSNEIFFNFDNPVTSLDPVEFYTANSAQDGTGTDETSNVAVTDTDLFDTAVKVTFDNTSGAVAYITEITLYGTPAKIVEEIYLRVQDDDSVEAFEEQPFVIENDLIQDRDGANSLALSLLNYYKDYSNTIELEVKGNPALQIGDNIAVNIDDISETYTVTKTTDILEKPGRYIQRIIGKVFNIPAFFILSDDVTPMSLLDGQDVLSP